MASSKGEEEHRASELDAVNNSDRVFLYPNAKRPTEAIACLLTSTDSAGLIDNLKRSVRHSQLASTLELQRTRQRRLRITRSKWNSI